ncbi:histidine kinase [Algoriphagus sp. SE2]|uniref:histidine kinase n=1 Tax=Algoriphagus sp. SE2 TaxID=3141536 RepID=UPI0031CD653C
MGNNLWVAFSGWYLVLLDILLIIGITCFLRLSGEKKASIFYWLPFLILSFTVFYENIGAYTLYDLEFRKAANAYLGNTEYPLYNLWVFNITNSQILTVLYLSLIRFWLSQSKKKYLTRMILFFVIFVVVIQLTGIEPIYLNQPFILAVGTYLILFGCGLYFIELMAQERFLKSNLLRLISFWQMTLIFFNYSLSYSYSISFEYLYGINPELTKSLAIVNQTMGILCLFIFVVTIASPFLPINFEREPNHESSIT